jgi:uncharacterized membrane protein YfcA
MELLIGLIIGCVLGLTGAGGAAFALPLLILAVGLPVQQAIGLSLATVAIGAGYGSLQRANKGDIFWWAVAILGVGGIIAAPLGKYLSTFVADIYLLSGFSVLTLFIAGHMWWRCRAAGTNANPNALCHFDSRGKFEPDARSLGTLAMSGVGVGSLAGFFGVGGGFLIVPLLHSVMGLSMRRAVASSLFIITLISLSGFLAHTVISPVIDWSQLVKLGGGAIAGMMLGGQIASHMNNTQLQRAFAIGLVLLALATLLSKTIQ